MEVLLLPALMPRMKQRIGRQLMRDIMMRLDTNNKFVRSGGFLLCCLMLVFLYIVLVRRGIPLLILGGMVVFGAMKKRWPVVVVSICLFLLGVFFTFQWTKSRAALEQLHFIMLRPHYQSVAEKLVEEVAQAADTHVWNDFGGGSNWFLSKDTDYSKIGEHVVVFFVTKYSDVSGYVYLSDDEARDIISEPWKYWPDVGDGPLFKEIHELGGRWMFVRTY